MRDPFSASSTQGPEPKRLNGVFCDVGATLLDHQNCINVPLAQALNKLYKSGVKVTIFTGGDRHEAFTDLMRHSLIDEMLVYGIENKKKFTNACLQVLIDDQNPAEQIYRFSVYGKHFSPDIVDTDKFVADVMAAIQESDAAPASAPAAAPLKPKV